VDGSVRRAAKAPSTPKQVDQITAGLAQVLTQWGSSSVLAGDERPHCPGRSKGPHGDEVAAVLCVVSTFTRVESGGNSTPHWTKLYTRRLQAIAQ